MRYFLTVGMFLSGVTTILFGFARYWNIHSLAYFVVIQVDERIAHLLHVIFHLLHFYAYFIEQS